MNDTVICALIAFGGVIISTLVSALASGALVNWRIQQLEKKVDEHNKWGEKFAGQETDIALMKADIQYIKENLNEIKDYIKKH